MRQQTLQYPEKKTFILTQSIYKSFLIPIFPPVGAKRVTVRKRGDFLRAGQHPLPRELVLYCRLHSDAQFISSPQNKVRIAQELASEQDEVRLAFSHDVIRLLRRRDHSHGAHDDVRMRLLDRLRKRNLPGK